MTQVEVQSSGTSASAARSTNTLRKAPSIISRRPLVPTRAAAVHPPFLEMIAVAIRTMKRRRGTSRQAIIKFVRTHYHLHSLTDKQFKVNLNRALRAGVERGTFVQVKGVGAVGSFRLGEALKGKPIECHIVRNPDNRGVRLGQAKASQARVSVIQKVAVKKPAGGPNHAITKEEGIRRYKLAQAGKRMAAASSTTTPAHKSGTTLSRKAITASPNKSASKPLKFLAQKSTSSGLAATQKSRSAAINVISSSSAKKFPASVDRSRKQVSLAKARKPPAAKSPMKTSFGKRALLAGGRF